jgi:hypothetical protein
MYAVRKGKTEAVKLLMSHGASVSANDSGARNLKGPDSKLRNRDGDFDEKIKLQNLFPGGLPSR